MAITNTQWGEGCTQMDAISSGRCPSWLPGTAQVWVLSSLGWDAYHFQLWGLHKRGLNVHRALKRALDTQWVITMAIIIQRSSSRLLLCRFWCSSAWWRPFAGSWFGIRLLYFFFPLFSIKARIYQSLREAGWVCVRALKRLPLSTHSLLKRFASLSCCLQSVWLSVSSLLRNGSSRAELRLFLSRCLSWALCCPVCFLE